MSVERIESLIVNARAEPHPALGGIDTAQLLAYLLDSTHEWWRRETIARHWREDLPEACVSPLLAVVMDASDTTEVRAAVLDALCSACVGANKARLLTWLQEEHHGEQAYGLEAKLILARARLGDVTAVEALARGAHDPWSHTRASAIEGLQALVARLGHDALLDELGYASYEQAATNAPRPELRLLAIRALEAAGADLSRYLADPDTSVARHVFDALGDNEVDRALLQALATSEASPEHTRCWALLALQRRGELVDAWIAELREPRVLLPAVPAEVRAAILAAHAPGERETDPRWLLERAMAEAAGDGRPATWDDDDPSPETAAALARLTEVLERRGLEPGRPASSGESRGQGGGTFFIIPTSAGGVWLSTLGPFATDDGNVDPDQPSAIRAAAQEAGLTWIDAALGRTTVTGLCVYFFGRRDPLSVHDLLFYWQD